MKTDVENGTWNERWVEKEAQMDWELRIVKAAEIGFSVETIVEVLREEMFSKNDAALLSVSWSFWEELRWVTVLRIWCERSVSGVTLSIRASRNLPLKRRRLFF